MRTLDFNTKLHRAENLESHLKKIIDPYNQYDVLGLYRKWLDENKILAETEDGWPTEEAYQKTNIDAFCNQFLSNP